MLDIDLMVTRHSVFYSPFIALITDGFFIAARKPNKAFDWHQLKKGSFIYVHGGQPEAILRYAAYKMG